MRKNYFIKKLFQTEFIVIFLCLILIGSIISGTIFYYKTNIELGNEYGRAHSKLKATGQIIQPNLFISYGIGTLIITIFTIFFTLLMSHKIAGPLYRFENTAKEISKGNLAVKPKIRGSDQVQELSDAFCEMVDQLKNNLTDIASKSKALNNELSEFKQMVGEKKQIYQTEINAPLQQLTKISSELENSIQFFKLS